MSEKSCLEIAQELIHGDRQAAYGHPYDDFSRTATIWTGILRDKLKFGEVITPEMVALMMIGVKISRLVSSPDHRDSIVDIAGYAGTYEMVMERKPEMPLPISDIMITGFDDTVIGE